MALEDLTGASKYIDALTVTNPNADDYIYEADDHVRGIKNVLKNTFPNINGAVNGTPAELNSLAGRQAFINSFLQSADAVAALAVLGVVIGTGSTEVPTNATINSVPTGSLFDFAGTSAPTGYLLCDGSAVSRTTYATLFALVGTVYGSGDGSTTFNLPDLRGRVVAGKDNMGGTSAERLTNQTGGIDGDTLGATGGAETHVLTTAQLPTLPGGQLLGDPVTTGSVGSGSGATAVVGFTRVGSDAAHNNVQPSFILNKIIKT